MLRCKICLRALPTCWLAAPQRAHRWGDGARQRSILSRLGMSVESFDFRRVKKLDGIGM